MIAITEDGYIQLPPKKPFGKLPSFKKPKLCLTYLSKPLSFERQNFWDASWN